MAHRCRVQAGAASQDYDNNLRVRSNLRGRRDPRMRTLVGSDESRFFSKLEFPWSLD